MCDENGALELVARALVTSPLKADRQRRSQSGNDVFRVWLADGRSVVLRVSPTGKTFAFTNHNLTTLRALGCPVQRVLATGQLPDGGSFIILEWLPGRDLIDELDAIEPARVSLLAARVALLQQRVASLPTAKKFGWAPIGRHGSLDRWDALFGASTEPLSLDETTVAGDMQARLSRLRHSLRGYFDALTPRCFLDDLTAKNLLIDDGELSGFIDLDYVCYGDPLMVIGSTLAGIVSEMQQPREQYVEELIRCWNPTPTERRAIWFYAGLWMFGFLRMTDARAEPAKVFRLVSGVRSVLKRAEDGERWESVANADCSNVSAERWVA